MKKKALSLAAYLIVLCLVTVSILLVYRQYDSLTGKRDNDWKTDMRMEGIRLTLDDLIEAQQKAVNAFKTQLKNDLDLLSMPLRSVVKNEGDEAIRNYEYGCVVRKDAKGVTLPEDAEYLPRMEAVEYEGTPPHRAGDERAL